ncbi:hypothetical protein FB565_006515 [Actinoplanes lutulentus]|uniref:Uncharacterized protein n=1 Tax=Actinoplanes lutulentus TaxID=1287878 RepID=A0A327ZC27_9ACTN|nr:hypothetical protein [Actinoplanes lutulentus]MBB2946747.1 hypothetical protein [Actinoplanes lutulentus]RAK35639.1 hypothetical protein B0I29_109112 [Actinoplanes lutulentus]
MARKRNRRPSTRQHDTAASRPEAPTERENPFAGVQRTGLWNLQILAAALSIALGILSVLTISQGGVSGVRLVPHLMCAVGAVCGAGFFFSKPYPALMRSLQIAAAAFTVLGVGGLVIAAGSG